MWRAGRSGIAAQDTLGTSGNFRPVSPHRHTAIVIGITGALTIALVVGFSLMPGDSGGAPDLQLAALTVAVLQIAAIMLVAMLALNRARTRAYGWEAIATAVVITGFAIATGVTGTGSDLAMVIRPPIGLIGLLAFALFDTGRPVTRVDRIVTVPASLAGMGVAILIGLTASVTPGAWAALPCTDGCAPYGLGLVSDPRWSVALQSLYALLQAAASIGCIVGLYQRQRQAVGWRRSVMRPLAALGILYAGVGLLLTATALAGLATELPSWVEPVLIVRRLVLPLAIGGGMLSALLLQRHASRDGMATLQDAADVSAVQACLRGIIGDPDVTVVTAAGAETTPVRPSFARTELRSPGGALLGAVEHRPARDGDEEEALAICVPAAALALDRISAHQRLQSASDTARQRLERDLHDGAQQNLVALRLRLGLLEARLADGPEDVRDDLDQLVEQAEVALDELRMLAHGTHRDDLARLGLRGALDHCASRAGAEVRLEGVTSRRLPPAVEEALYFAAREAIQNTTKHGRGAVLAVTVVPDGADVAFEFTDVADPAAPEAPGDVPRTIATRIADIGGVVNAASSACGGRRITGRIAGAMKVAGERRSVNAPPATRWETS